jgi:hypothetical protein
LVEPQQERPVDENATPEKRIAAFQAWVESHRNLNLPNLSDEAISRESIYEPLSQGINSLSDS